MKKFVVSALALVAVAGAANAQSLVFRVAERFNTASLAAGATTATGNATGVAGDNRIGITVYGRLNSAGSNLLGIGGYAFQVVTNDAGTGGNFVTATSAQDPTRQRNAAVASASNAPGYTPFLNADGDSVPSGQGVFNPYRVVANLGDLGQGARTSIGGNNALELITGATSPGEYGSIAAGNATAAQWGLDAEIPLFTFMYDVTDFAARTLTFTITGEVGTFTGFDSGAPVAGGTSAQVSQTYSVSIVPAPGAAALLGLGGLLAARRRRA